MSTELCVVFQEIQVVLAYYVALTVHDIVLVLSIIVVNSLRRHGVTSKVLNPERLKKINGK